MDKILSIIISLAISGTNLFAVSDGGFSGNHLINNKEYRSKVESSFKEREHLAQNRKDKLFNVFGFGLSLQQEEALKFLFAYMPLSDLADYNGDFFLANANIALKIRKESPWGKDIPEEIFLHYVLPLRINFENLDSFRIAYYDEIQGRVKGMDATDAALEINHWCNEKATYQPYGMIYSGPVSTILSAQGACVGLSTFTVASLRTAGIPARQVYTSFAHDDDAHAWVEVWINGKWYYMGACEPEPVLDRAWHTELARRAMLINTKSFGAKYGQENATVCYRNYSDVNTLSKYAVTKQINVKVLDTNNVPVKDALVEYLLYLSARFTPLAEVPTDEFGISQFETGLGDLLIWARKGADFNFKKVSVYDIDTLNLILNLKPADNGFQELDLGVPIARAPLKGPAVELITANTKRINDENMIRQAYIDSWMKPEEAANLAKELGADPEIVKDIISRSMGNYKNIASFLTHTPVSDRSLAINLLKQVSDQDLRDTKEEIFADHLNNVIRFEDTHGAYDYELYSQYVLNPNIMIFELIVAWRKYLFESMPAGFRQDAINDPSILMKYVNNNIVIDDSEDYWKIAISPISPKGVDELKVSDSFSRDIYFVALCRSLGIPSRIESGSNGYVPQFYFKKEWHDVWLAGRNQPLPGKGFVRLSSGEKNPVPEYFIHFTIAHFENGHYKTLRYPGKTVTDFKDELALAPGHYMLVTGNRINDSKILSTLSFFELKENEHKAIDIKLRKDVSPAEILGTIDLNIKISLPDKSGIILKSIADKGIVLAWIDPDKEPTKHIFSDLPLLKAELDSWGGYFIFLSNQSEASNNFKLESIKGLPANSLYSVDIDSKILKEITKSVSLSDIHYPFLVLTDKNGNIILKSEGYRIGIGEQILKRSDK
ncbi:MAG TPA: transglutaminase domain-containing protein [Bacteroidales bacterium]|nr:transglutaminase domain-containing protein [Bacteroidales bacterium]